MNRMEVHPIGTIAYVEGEFSIVLNPEYAPALRGLDGYSHVQVVWWFDRAEDADSLIERKPYTRGPEELGVFATRSPMRPNPIAVSSVDIAYVDEEGATLGLYYIDAYPGRPVLDLKPYTPSIDRVESPTTPDWCSHWPRSYEESEGFDWRLSSTSSDGIVNPEDFLSRGPCYARKASAKTWDIGSKTWRLFIKQIAVRPRTNER